MRVRIFSVALCCLIAILGLSGCGGGGGDLFGSQDQVAEDFLLDRARAVENEDLDQIDDLLASDYLDDCVTREEFVDDYADLFSSPGFQSIEVNILDIRDEDVDEERGTASFVAETEVLITESGQTRRSVGERDFYLVFEDGRWREIGDQTCDRSVKQTPNPLSWIERP